MKGKVIAVQSLPGMTENRAQWCQLSGHSRIRMHDIEPFASSHSFC
jgi:hypothetical protein